MYRGRMDQQIFKARAVERTFWGCFLAAEDWEQVLPDNSFAS